MTDPSLYLELAGELAALKAEGLYKAERVIVSPQGASIRVSDGREVLNFCANNYLGLANHRALIEAAHEALMARGYGMSSVRFICGTQDLHQQLERRLASFLGMEDAALYSSCFDANGGLFEALLSAHDAVISDALNHASIIDGIRLCKARRYRYANGDMDELEARLKDARDTGAKRVLIATDGVFSMDGTQANLPEICDLADRYCALVMVDDSHAVGIVGDKGRGTPEACGVQGRVDLLTGTLGKALGGASGGYTAARKEVVDWLRQRSRPYLFSNTLAPVIAATSLVVLDLLESSEMLRRQLKVNTAYVRDGLTSAGFRIVEGNHPIVPVMLGDAALATRFASKMLDAGIYVIGFSYPVVPKGAARIRIQVSAAHQPEHLDLLLEAFVHVGRQLGVV